MTKNEKVLLNVFFLLVLVLFFIFSFSYSIQKKNDAEIDIKKYTELINKIDQKSNEIHYDHTTLNIEKKSVNDIVETILLQLKFSGIIPTKYQISGDKRNPSIIYTFNCKPNDLLSFITKEKNKYIPYKIKNFNLKNDSTKLVVNMKYINESSYEKMNISQKSNQAIIKLLQPAEISVPVQNNEEIIVQEKKDYEESSTLKIIGNIKQSDVEYLCIKDNLTNKIAKIKKEDIIEIANDFYIIDYEGKKIKIFK